MTRPQHEGHRACPICAAEARGETIDPESWLPPVPTDKDLSKVLEEMRDFIAEYPTARLGRHKTPQLVIWVASFIPDPDNEVSRYWAVSGKTHVRPEDLREIEVLVRTQSHYPP
jgi:hypothetical protein